MNRLEIKEALSEITKNAQAPALNYAVNYAKYALAMIASDASDHDLKVQLLYVQNNITHWRGEIAKKVRAVLKGATK